jgi:2Fe-2S iron-sulfur cluster binding domain
MARFDPGGLILVSRTAGSEGATFSFRSSTALKQIRAPPKTRAAGHPAPFACKGGVCAACRAKVTAGTDEMKVNYGLSPEEVAEGYILPGRPDQRGPGAELRQLNRSLFVAA